MNISAPFFIQKKITRQAPVRGIFRCVAILLLLLLPAQIFAQKDAKAKEWLDKSAAVFNKSGGASIHFTLNISDVPSKIAESFDGRLDLKGTKFHMETPEIEIWFNGKTQWLLQKSFDEVHVSEPSMQEAQALNPAAVFNLYQKDCNYKYLGAKTDKKGRKVQEVELIPKTKDSDMARIVMQIGASDAIPSKIHIVYKNKIENVIYINKYQPNTALTDSSFTFDPKKYPDAELIDLR